MSIDGFGNCNTCGRPVTTGGCIPCDSQRTYCAACGQRLYPPSFEHQCPNIRLVTTKENPR